MKHKSRFAPLALAMGGTMALVGGVADAGSKWNGNGSVQVTVNADGSGIASGYLGAIYNNTATTVEYIGCQKGSDNRILCLARVEGAATNVNCSARSAYLAQAISSLSGDARLIFTWNASGTCTGISVGHSSEYQDKQ
jgi:hypothetical protein